VRLSKVLRMAKMLLLALSLLAGLADSLSLSAEFSDKAWKQRPVSKVINLLKDMQEELEKEQDADEDLYDAFTCWCEANDKGKSKAIADAEQHSADLTSTIEMTDAKHEQLTTDIAELKRQIAENTDALNTATALREKEGSEFHENEKDSIQAIGNLKAAVVAMQKHHGEALTQESMVQIQQVLKEPLARRPNLLVSWVWRRRISASLRRFYNKVGDMFAMQRQQAAPSSGL